MGNKTTPLYVQIQQYLLQLIEGGTLGPGDRLPTEKVLADRFGTARSTVVTAMQPLVQSGRIVKEVGRGSFVGKGFIDTTIASPVLQSLEEQLAQQGTVVSYRFLGMEAVSASCAAGKALRVKPSEELYQLRRVRMSDGKPISIETRHLRMELGRRLLIASLQEKPFIEMLSQELGIAVDRINGVISTAPATEREAALLLVAIGDPLLSREYIIHDVAGQPISHGVSCYTRSVRFSYSGGGAGR